MAGLKLFPQVLLAGAAGIAVTIGSMRQTNEPPVLFNGGAVTMLLPEDTTKKDSLPYPLEDQTTTDYLYNNLNAFDFDLPSGIEPVFEYDPETGEYIYNEQVGGLDYRQPQYFSFEEYMEAEMNKSITDYWVERSTAQSLLGGQGTNPSLYTGSELLDRLFGGSTVDIRPQGNIDLTFGGSFQNVGNPILTEDQRRQGGFDFNMDINANMLGQIGEKMKLTFNYNTSATFDFENQVKLEYTGYEDEIIQKIEAGNVSLPLTTSLIPGTQSLWGIKTQLQFGRLTMTNILSQQRSQSQSIQIEGGAQKRQFEVFANQYDENRHFFLTHYMRNNYENWLSTLPFVNSPVNITRMEVWVTNTTGATQNTRDVVAFTDLAETDSAYWVPANGGTTNVLSTDGLPKNNANDLYGKLVNDPNARNLNTVVSALSDPAGQYRMQPVRDFEKVRMRKLNPGDFTYNNQLGFISVNTSLQPDDVLAVAFEYTYLGQVYQVGEFTNNLPPGVDTSNVMFLKMLKSTSAQVQIPLWDLMMKNVYSLGAFQVSAEDFQLDILYQDPGGGFKRYIPTNNGEVNGVPIITLLNLDRLNNNNDPFPDGVFDFVNGITINTTNGRIYFPVLEPFGSYLRSENVFDGDPEAERFAYDELYNTTRVLAEQFPQYNRFVMTGSYKSSVSSEIYLGAFNLPKGSVNVTAGGQQLTENIDYTIDYSLGRLKIINESILNSGLPINVSFENNAFFGFQVKSLIGSRFDYWINDNFTLGATVLRLSERPFTQKVNFGDDPISNTMLGFDFSYTEEAPWLTRALDKLPFYDTKETSTISVTGEVARFLPGHSKAIGKDDEGTIYIDDFEGSRSAYDLKFPFSAWVLASTPQNAIGADGNVLFPEATLFDSLAYGKNRAKIAWYTIDPLFLRRDNPARPDHLTEDDVSNHYLVEIQQQEIFPQADIAVTGLNNLSTFDLAYYPTDRGPYNFDVEPTPNSAGINSDGQLVNPESRWGGIMRSIETNDFEAANIEIIEFWVMDPFDNLGPFGSQVTDGGDLYINVGNVSEDILKDSRTFFENGLPKDGSLDELDATNWGLVPRTLPINQAFDNDPASRENQDKGYDGQDDNQESEFYADYINALSGIVSDPVLQAIQDDPAGDNYHYFRGGDYDNLALDVFQRYKRFNNPQGNSPTTESSPENYPTSATNLPESEDLNRDYTLSETEAYFQYRIPITPDMATSNPYITDVVVAAHQFENGITDSVRWYQFKVPLNQFDARIGTIQDFRSIRFIRMFMTGFEEPVVLRFARLELVRNQWRRYQFSLLEPGEYLPDDNTNETVFNVSAVSIEENSGRQPYPYVLPPGVQREQTIGGGGNVSTFQQNEQALSMQVCPLKDGDSRGIIKSLNLDLRRYGRMIMNVHGEPLVGSGSNPQDGDLTVFIRLGSDFTNNYYEYEVPLKMSKSPLPAGTIEDDNVREAVWATLLNFPLDSLIKTKMQRNDLELSPLVPYSIGGEGMPTITVIGNPDLGYVEEVMIGVRNPKSISGSGEDFCAEVWVNELRLTEIDEQGGWAALARVDAQLADLGTLTVSGNMHTTGFGTLDQQINERYLDNFYQYSASLSLDLGKFFPESVGLRLPFYASISESFSNPEFDPYTFDVDLDEKVASLENLYGQDSARAYRRQAIQYTSIRSINLTNIKLDPGKAGGDPRLWSPRNFDATVAFSQDYNSNPILEYDIINRYKGSIGYVYGTRPQPFKPFDKLIDRRQKWLQLVRDINFNPLPTSYSFRTEMNRQFGETLQRDVYGDGLIQPTFNKFFNWDRFYGLKLEPFTAMKIDFSATTNARIDEPFGKIDTPEEKDSLWNNIRDFGRTINYRHSVNVNYNVPLNKIPVLSWTSLRTSYNTTYGWTAGSFGLADSLGHILTNTQGKTINGELNFRNLYNKSDFLKKYNTATFSKRDDRARDGNSEMKQSSSKEDEKEDEKKKEIKVGPTGEILVRLLISMKRITINYSENYSTTLPGFMQSPQLIGMNFNDGPAPGWDFILGVQPTRQWLDDAADNGWISSALTFNSTFLQNYSENLDIRANFEPLPDLRLDINMNKNYSENHSEFFRNTGTLDMPDFEHLNPMDNGSLTMSYSILGTIFDKLNTTEVTATFRQFEENRLIISQRFGNENIYSEGDFFDVQDSTFLANYFDGYGPYSQDVLVPAFIAAYRDIDANTIPLNIFEQTPKPNWRLTYTGLTKIPAMKKLFSNVTLNSAYTSTLAVNSYITNLNYYGNYYLYANVIDTLSGNFFSQFSIPNVILSEQFSPVFGVDATFVSSLSTKFDFRKTRTLSMSFIDFQLTEIRSTEFTIGLGYTVAGLILPIRFGGKKPTLENDVTFRFDMSFRDDITTNFRLDQDLNEPTGGLTIIQIAPTIDYLVNDRFNVQLYFNRQQTIPKISTAFPITTTNAGVKVRMSLAE